MYALCRPRRMIEIICSVVSNARATFSTVPTPALHFFLLSLSLCVLSHYFLRARVVNRADCCSPLRGGTRCAGNWRPNWRHLFHPARMKKSLTVFILSEGVVFSLNLPFSFSGLFGVSHASLSFLYDLLISPSENRVFRKAHRVVY